MTTIAAEERKSDMTELKLGKLPDRTPVKLSITVSPELHKALQKYAQVYKQTYGEEEAVVELIPFMLEDFLSRDRKFAKELKRTMAGPVERAARVAG